jgi:hypothetical protein
MVTQLRFNGAWPETRYAAAGTRAVKGNSNHVTVFVSIFT